MVRTPVWKKNSAVVRLYRRAIQKLGPRPIFWLVPFAAVIVVILVVVIWDKSPHKPPVGTYIALVGLLVAILSALDRPSARIKVGFILAATALTVAEVHKLYVTTNEQENTFSAIQGKLDATKGELDVTEGNLDIARQRLEAAAHNVQDELSQTQQIRSELLELSETINLTTSTDAELQRFRLRNEIDDLGDLVFKNDATHGQALRTLNHHINTLESQMYNKDPNLATEVKDLKQRLLEEDDRYRNEYFQDLLPKMVDVTAELQILTGNDFSPDRSKLTSDLYRAGPDSASQTMNKIRELETRLPPLNPRMPEKPVERQPK